MKKNLYLVVGLCVMASCTGMHAQREKSVVYNVPEYTEPDWTEIDNFQCHQDQWLRVPEEMLNSALIAQLVDGYNANVVWHSVESDMECFWRWEGYTDSAMIAMDLTIIRDDATRVAATQFCEASARSQRDKSIDANQVMGQYIDFVTSTYHVSTYSTEEAPTEDAYWEAMDKSNWVTNWEKLSAKRGQSDAKHQTFLLHAIDTASGFDARCVYALEYAHSSEDGPGFAAAIPVLVKLLAAGQYSPLLREIWQTWRAMQCTQMGASKDSDIPNAEYNRLRMITCYTMLCHLHDNPNDWIAINNFLITSYLDNITRFGEYAFGNQSIMEGIECFPEYFERFSTQKK